MATDTSKITTAADDLSDKMGKGGAAAKTLGVEIANAFKALDNEIAALAGGGGGSGIEEAPKDGNTYGRQNASWVAMSDVTPPNPEPIPPDPEPVPPDGGGLPAGVTLQAIDGGPSYYADHGFTNAVTSGWDKPTAFPISFFLERCGNQTEIDHWRDIKANTMLFAQSDAAKLPLLRSNGMYLVAQAGEIDKILADNNVSEFGTETTGIGAWDEPGTYEQAIEAIQTTPNKHQDARFFHENYTWNSVAYGDVGGHQMDDLLNDMIATPNGTKRHLDFASVDIYWFAGDNGADGGAYNSGLLYQRALLTKDERRRGTRYGDMIDWIRIGNPICKHAKWQATYPAPVSVYIETGGPFQENTTIANYAQPPEINAAVWSTLIHGARYIQYFGHTFGTAGGDNILHGGSFYKTPYPGQSISVYDQVKTTNTMVSQMATVLNSPFALGYVTVDPLGWKFGDPALSAFKGDGFDVMAKYHNVAGGDNKFYIFAMPRYSPSKANQTATFTIKANSATTVTVVGENRTIPITSGTSFKDNFANGHTVHIYRIG